MSNIHIQGLGELWVECDQCYKRAERALCETHWTDVIEDAMDDGCKEERNK